MANNTVTIPAAAYYRMSSDSQKESIPAQQTAVREYAQQHGYHIVAEYSDRGISGWKSEERVQFQRLIEDAQKGKFRAVLVWDVDRFSRFPVLEANHYWFLLDRAGVHLASVAQGRLNFEDLGEWLKASITQYGKAEFVRDLGRNVVRGCLKAARAGKPTGGKPLYGFRRDETGAYAIDPAAASVVERIFKVYLGPGGSIRSVTNMLNAEGLPSPNGRRWNAGAIKYMLHSRKYCGDLVYGRQQVGCYFRSTDGVVTAVTRNTPKGKNTPSVVVPGAMPRIIDERLWEAAQRKLKSNKTRAVSPGGHSYALRGILKCECGRGMTGVPERPELRAPPRYVCIGFKHMGSSVCHSNTVCEPVLVDFLRHVIQNRIFPEDMLQDVEKRIRQMTARTHEPADELRELNRELKAMDARIAQGAKRLLAVSDAAVPDVAAALDELKAERARLAARLEELTRGSVKAADKRRERDEALGALMALRDLRAAVAVATGVELQHLFQTVFSRIDLRFSHKRNGKRMVNTLVGGTIAFYPVFSRSSTGSKS